MYALNSLTVQANNVINSCLNTVSVPWEEPEMLSNCWIQLMVSERYSFAPSCNEDGSFLAKQCFLERFADFSAQCV
jgi:hypothetical protein